MHQFFPSIFFNFEFVRLLGSSHLSGCEPGELLDLIPQIKDSDPESWFTALTAAAITAEEIATSAQLSGDRGAFRKALLRTSNYYRAAQFMLNSRPGHEDPRSLATSQLSITAFRRGVKLLDGDVQFLSIPYLDPTQGQTTLPAYLYLPCASKRLPGRATPVLIATGGLDSTVEELYFIAAGLGPDLGYAVLTFEGPGQGITLRRSEQPLHMRPDWEVVVDSVLDELFVIAKDQPDLGLDLESIALTGGSLGGYYALRGAADPRVKACVAMDPFHSLFQVAASRMPASLLDGWAAGSVPDEVFSAILDLVGTLDFKVSWEFNQLQWAFGVGNNAEVMKKMKGWTLGEGFLEKIKCPVLITGAEASLYTDPEQSTKRIFEELVHLGEKQKKMWIGKTVATGGLQAKVGVWALAQQKTFAFLDEVFEVKRQMVMS